jgi:3-phosphoshikimate 1-carboxyvinyltransferase
MPLPNTLEILPPQAPVQAALTIPGSKSITNRALVLAALARRPVTLRGALWSEDTEVMTEALRQLGVPIQVDPDPHEPANRTLTVQGCHGTLPNAGTHDRPLPLHVGNAGTAARFLTALTCLGHGTYQLDGVPRMRERPQAELFNALRQLGYRLDTPNDRLPVTVHGTGPKARQCTVSIHQSSQFASALLLCSRIGTWEIRLLDDNPEESPYVSMTRQLMDAFPHDGGVFDIDADASSASYFWAAHALQQLHHPGAPALQILNAPTSNWQVDSRFPSFLPLPKTLSRQSNLGDSIMTAVVLAPWAQHPVHFTHLERLRVQECERVHALRTELSRCGARVQEHQDTLTVHPGPLHGATIETYHDHRMAMCFAILGLHVPNLKIKNPACVRKTFPTFFQKLAAAPPHGLGVTLLDADTRQPLSPAAAAAD